MKRLALALALVWWSPASAQQAVDGSDLGATRNLSYTKIGGADFADSTGKMLRLDGNRRLETVDGDRDRDKWALQATVTDTTAVGTADSTGVYDTHDAARLSLFVTINLPAGIAASAVPWVRIALQVRAHSQNSADSSSTFAWRHRSGSGNAGGGVSTSLSDSLTFAADTTITTAVAASTNEIVCECVADRSGDQWQNMFGGNGACRFYIPLVDRGGWWFWAPYTSVRWRVLTAVANTARVTVRLVGVAL